MYSWFVGLFAAVFAAAPLPSASCPNRSPSAGLVASRQCLSCHDGVLAPDVAEAPQIHDGPHGEGGHPVGMSYAAAVARGDAALRSSTDVQRALALPAGNVECVTCHAPGSAAPHQLALPERHSALCFACHRM